MEYGWKEKTKKPLELTPVRNQLSYGHLTPHAGSGSDLTACLLGFSHPTVRTLSQVLNLCQQGLKNIWWCPVKDSNLQLSVSKTAASTNFANWTWWGWMDLNQLCPKTNRFTVCRASPSAPHPHVRGSISFGLGGRIRTCGLLLPRQAVYRTDNTPRGYGWRKIKGCVHNAPDSIHVLATCTFFCCFCTCGSGGWICTSGLILMRHPRYSFSTPQWDVGRSDNPDSRRLQDSMPCHSEPTRLETVALPREPPRSIPMRVSCWRPVLISGIAS